MTQAPLRILVVCTANICRSPMAEAFLRSGAEARGIDVDVSSAGFLFDDEPPSDVVVGVMAELGHDISEHRARRATEALVADADVVVTMERRHARDLTLLAAGEGRKVHTLVGLVASLESAESPTTDSPVARVEAAAVGREPSDFLGDGPDEVLDPYGRSRKVNRQTAETLHQLSERLLDGLFSGLAEPDAATSE